MSQIIRGSLLSLSAALLLLLPWFDGLAVGEVKKGFSDCLRFFYNKKLPTGLGEDYSSVKEYQPICQRYKKDFRFATLYHKQSRTAVFSAYIMSPSDVTRPENPTWMYEPQLANRKSSWEMQPFQTTIPKDVFESQAVLDDYRTPDFTKGHLAPCSHQNTKEDKEATFTLTNIVPQKEKSNSPAWSRWEEKVRKRFKNCKGEMYVITGVMPYKSRKYLINDRVAVPEYIWSAYCCPRYASKLPEDMQHVFPAYGAVGRNDNTSDDKIVPKTNDYQGYDVREMSLEDLENILRRRMNMKGNVKLFDPKCSKPKNP